MASGRKVTFGVMSAAVAALIGVLGLAGNSPRAKYEAERFAALEQHRAALRQGSEIARGVMMWRFAPAHPLLAP